MADKKTLVFEVSKSLADDFKKVCDCFGKSNDDMLSDILRDFVATYQDHDGNVHLTPAKAIVNNRLHDCYYIRDRKLYGSDYMTVLLDGQIMHILADKIRVEENNGGAK